MLNVRNELLYILVVQLLEKAAEQGLLTPEELSLAEAMAMEKYRPETVWQ